MPYWASAGRATWVSTWYTSICTRRFPPPIGGGGPGSGPLPVKADLVPFLPVPVVGEAGKRRRVLSRLQPAPIHRESQGLLRQFPSNGASLCLHSFHGTGGSAAKVSEDAVLAANYLMAKLKSAYDLSCDRICKHEFVLSAKRQKANGVTARDIANGCWITACMRQLCTSDRGRGADD